MKPTSNDVPRSLARRGRDAIASPVDKSPFSIYCLTASPPAADTILASSAAEAA
jgi:hypothetical protein